MAPFRWLQNQKSLVAAPGFMGSGIDLFARIPVRRAFRYRYRSVKRVEVPAASEPVTITRPKVIVFHLAGELGSGGFIPKLSMAKRNEPTRNVVAYKTKK